MRRKIISVKNAYDGSTEGPHDLVEVVLEYEDGIPTVAHWHRSQLDREQFEDKLISGYNIPPLVLRQYRELILIEEKTWREEDSL